MIKEPLEISTRHQERMKAPRKEPIAAKIRRLFELLRLVVEIVGLISLIFSGWPGYLQSLDLLPFASQCEVRILADPHLFIRALPSLDGYILGAIPLHHQAVVTGSTSNTTAGQWFWVEYCPFVGATKIAGWSSRKFMRFSYTTACNELCTHCLKSQLVDDIYRAGKRLIGLPTD